jgi:two-component system cell cycle sensor histidine kinase/response regulator CckA
VSPGVFTYLEVEDSGHGIEPAMLGRIFDPFFTTKLEGRGLGLAGVMGIVRGHAGAIRVESSPRRGTCFRVLLPARVGASVRAEREEEACEQARAIARVVLVVDDEELVRETAREMLRQLRSKALVASSGREAVEFYRENRSHIDLVLLDLTMPGLNGSQTLRELRAIDPEVRVVFMSGYAFADSAAEAGEPKPPFLRKPFTIGDLRRTMASALGASL